MNALTPGDRLQRFLFENAAIRGAIVQLDTSWRNALERREYPDAVADLLGEMMAASVLLTSSLKFEGALVMQVQGDGPLSLLVAECASDLAVRATAKWRTPLVARGLRDLVGSGRFVITLDPRNGREAYQGMVEITGASVNEVLEHYMLQSEQVETRLFLACDRERAVGMMLQRLPGAASADADAWNRAGKLAETVAREELLTLAPPVIVRRLFHQEDIRLFDAEVVTFRCTCSRDRVAAMLRMLGRDEVRSILAEQGRVDIACDFCGRQYRFDPVDAEQLFASESIDGAGPTRH